jgi:hypothetical protein
LPMLLSASGPESSPQASEPRPATNVRLA